MRAGKLVRRGGAVLLGLLVALGALEFGLRQFAPQGVVTDWVRYEPAPGLVGYRMRPHQWVPGPLGGPINGLGLRGAELANTGPRMLVLGDSFVFGAGVGADETFVAKLAQEVPFEVLNGGTPGYGTWRELAWLEHFGDGLGLDEVVLCVFEGNDFQDNLELRAPAMAGGVLFGPVDAATEPGTLAALLVRSHVWRALTKRTRGGGEARRVDSADPGSPGPDGDASGAVGRPDAVLDAFARAQAERLVVYVPEELEAELGHEGERGLGDAAQAVVRRVELGYAMTELALAGVADWCAAREVGLTVVLIPDVLGLDPDQRGRALLQNEDAGLREALASAVDLDRPRVALAAWCEALGVPLVDLAPAFRAETAALRVSEGSSDAGHEGLYLFGDSHWNARGHALAAELIAEALVPKKD